MDSSKNISHLAAPGFKENFPDEFTTLHSLHPSDIAEAIEESELEPKGTIELLLSIDHEKALETFSQLSERCQQNCLETGAPQIMLPFVESMDADDRVDLLKGVDDEVRETIMPLIAQAERNDIRRLWNYEEGTAGSVMTTEYTRLPRTLTVEAALEQLRLVAPNKETIYYTYITDSDQHLIGILSLRDLIMSRRSKTLDSIMESTVISVPHWMEEEEVAAVISKYDLLAVPVVDDNNKLLGIITVDDVLDIIEAESTEDFHRISAVLPFEEEYFQHRLSRLFWNRFIWLALLLFTSLLSTTIMELNAAVLQQMVALAFFIPMVTGTCGNAGTQSATMVVRALALGEIQFKDFGRVFRREVMMGAVLGGALGLMAYFRVFFQDHDIVLGYIVAVSIVATLLTANLTGALLPLILKRFKLDPALTAGPFIATIIDAVGITIYFQVAIFLMK